MIKELEDLYEEKKYSDIIDILIDTSQDYQAANIRSDNYRVHGCLSVFWCRVTKQDDRYFIEVDCESLFLKGAFAILLTDINLLTRKELMEFSKEYNFVKVLGTSRHRNNPIGLLLTFIKNQI